MQFKKVCIVVGARPNFMKVAPLLRELVGQGIFCDLVHTGQHYDQNMSKVFFEDLGIPTHNVIFLHMKTTDTVLMRITRIMQGFQPILLANEYSCVIVVGDVDSTLAASLTAKLTKNKLVHIESGLRSFDPDMPEEFNRVLIDRMSDILFTTESSAEKNLLNEGISSDKIFFVGNIMIDNLKFNLSKIRDYTSLKSMGDYALVTLHRPSNVDDKKQLKKMLELLSLISEEIHLKFVLHPRTEQKIREFDLNKYFLQDTNISPLSSLGPSEFLKLMLKAKFILTDSGGIQEEASYLNIPVLTLRQETERPITVTDGSNEIVGDDKYKTLYAVRKILNGEYKKAKKIRYWDGNASRRIVKILIKKGFIENE